MNSKRYSGILAGARSCVKTADQKKCKNLLINRLAAQGEESYVILFPELLMGNPVLPDSTILWSLEGYPSIAALLSPSQNRAMRS